MDLIFLFFFFWLFDFKATHNLRIVHLTRTHVTYISMCVDLPTLETKQK